MKPPRDARDLALKRLDVREYSAQEMLGYLKRKGIEPAEAERVIADLVRAELISDRRYAKVVARHQSHRGKGPRYVLQKLKQKGVRMEMPQVREVLSEVSDRSELEIATEVLERRYPDYKTDEKEKARAYQALLRRGFSSDVVRKALFG